VAVEFGIAAAEQFRRFNDSGGGCPKRVLARRTCGY